MKNATLQIKMAATGHNEKTILKGVFSTKLPKGLFMLLLLFVSMTVVKAQTTYYVNDGSNVGDVYTSATGNDLNSGTSSAPFATINKAYTTASSGDIIMVDAGTYYESLNLVKTLTITGAGASTILTDANACTLNSGTTGIFVSSNGIKLNEFKVTNFDRGIIVQSKNVELYKVESSNNCNFGITLGLWANNVKLQNCKFNNNTLSGVRSGTAHHLKHLLIDACEIKGNEIGISVSATSSSGQKPNVYDSITITNNDISNNIRRGMYFEKLSNALISNNFLDNNGNSATDTSNIGIDINLRQGSYSNITITNNEIINCGALGGATTATRPCAMAIKARDDGANGGSLDNVLVKNNFIHGPRNGLRIGENYQVNSGPTNITVTENSFLTGEAVYDLINLTTNSNIPATCNWYGANNAGTIAGLISGSFNYIPYLVNGTDNSGAIGFQPTPVTLSVNAGPDVTTYYGYTLPYQTATLTATVSGGSGNYAYSWSPGGATTASITVSPTDTTTYTCTVTDNNGCVNGSSDAVDVLCMDIRCDNGMGGVVVVCRWRLVGGVVTRTTECVAAKAVPKILIKGDLGPCHLLSKRNNVLAAEDDMFVYPNPSTGQVSIGMPLSDAVQNVKIINSVGQVVYQTSTFETVLETNLSHLPKGIYYVECINPENSYFKKLVLN